MSNKATGLAKTNAPILSVATVPCSASSVRLPESGAPAVTAREDSEHLRTEHLLGNLKSRAISSGAITIAAQALKFGLSLTTTVVLSRLLTPGDFGVISMATSITAFLRVFKDAGLSTATVQRENITHAQVSNLFWINIAVSLSISGFICLLAPAVAWFYSDDRLIPVTILLSLTFVISGSCVQHQAILARQMKFKALSFIEVFSMVIGLLLGSAMAVFGFGYWSLVGQSLSTEIAALASTWFFSGWRPKLASRNAGTRSLIAFGANLTAGTFLYFLARGMDVLLIGRFYGSEPLGLYSRASAMLLRPLEQSISPIAGVLTPVLSRLQAQRERYRSTFLAVYNALALATFPMTAALLAVSKPLTLVLLGKNWESAAPIFAAFTFAALTYPLCTMAAWLFPTQGRGEDMLKASSISSAVTLISICIGLPFGVASVALSFSVATLLIRLPVLYFLAGRIGPVSTRDLWRGFFVHLPLWTVIAATTYAVRFSLREFGPIQQLLGSSVVAILSTSFLIAVFPQWRDTVARFFRALKAVKYQDA